MRGVASPAWWRNAAVYQIYPLSFADANGDGYGDLPGITSRLGHLAAERGSLGVDAIWLSPIYPSPMVDFGYDVTDHCAVDPRFGSLDDADDLIREAHRRGLRVLLDYVPNHTSDRHPWFEQSRSGRGDPRRDWYVWRDPAADGGPPNNWLSAFAGVGPAWTLDPATGQYYLHSYTAAQPDLDWRNPAVRAAMHDVLRFWLDRGVDGFRVDAPHRLGKDVALRDNEPDVVGLRVATQLDDRRHRNLDDPVVHEFLRGIRQVTSAYPGTVLIGEVGIHHPGRRAAYYGAGDELDLVFDFGFWTNEWRAEAFRAGGEDLGRIIAAGGHPTHALSNHDISRAASRFPQAGVPSADPGSRTRIAALLLGTLPGTTFLYYGEEIGMTDVPVPPALATDPNGRDPVRTPMQWDLSAPGGGFTRGTPWLPLPPDGVDVATQADIPDSLLSLHRRLLELRRTHPALSADSGYEELAAPPDVYAYRRGSGEDALVVVLNFADEPRTAALGDDGDPPSGRVVLDSRTAAPGGPVDLGAVDLLPNQGLVLGRG